LRSRELFFFLVVLGIGACRKDRGSAPVTTSSVVPTDDRGRIAPSASSAADASIPSTGVTGSASASSAPLDSAEAPAGTLIPAAEVFSDSTPLCGLPAPVPTSAKEERQRTAWLAAPEAQQRVTRLNADLEGLTPPSVGLAFDDTSRTIILVLAAPYESYRGLAQRLQRLVSPMRIALRPSCHSPAQMEHAKRVLEGRQWHPKASVTPMAWYLDPSFAGYRVTIDDSAPEVRDALQRQLGSLVQTELGKPRRL
jgi:hypothetical protein